MSKVPFTGSVKVRVELGGRTDVNLRGRSTKPPRNYGYVGSGDEIYVLASDAKLDSRMKIISEVTGAEEGFVALAEPIVAEVKKNVSDVEVEKEAIKETKAEVLAKLPHVGKKTAEHFIEAGYSSFAEIAELSVEQVLEFSKNPTLNEEKAQEIINVAKRFVANLS